MRSLNPIKGPRIKGPSIVLALLLATVLLLLSVWVNFIYAHEERFCSLVPLSYAAGRVKAAKAVSGRAPASMEDAITMLAGRASETMLKPDPEVRSLQLKTDQDGFTLTVTTDCFFFRRSTQRYDWKEDAFSRAVLSSGKPPEE